MIRQVTGIQIEKADRETVSMGFTHSFSRSLFIDFYPRPLFAPVKAARRTQRAERKAAV
jgi:hypothetical protein